MNSPLSRSTHDAMMLAVAFLCLLVISSHSSPSEKLLPFQGRLSDAQGRTVPDGARVVQFKLYDAPVGGRTAWMGEVQKLSVNGGIASTTLGSKASLRDVDFDQALYLELTLDANDDGQITLADPPLLPRQAVMAGVFAKESAIARQSLDSAKLAGKDWSSLMEAGSNDPGSSRIAEAKLPSNALVPVGGVIMWWGKTTKIPLGFELCDGEVPSTPGAILEGRKPNLRDRFPKGASSGNQDVQAVNQVGGSHFIGERRVGGTALTEAQMPRHTHDWVFTQGIPIYRGTPPETTETGGFDSGGLYGPTTGHGSLFIAPTGGDAPHDHVLPGHDNRPEFLEMLFIIRVK